MTEVQEFVRYGGHAFVGFRHAPRLFDVRGAVLERINDSISLEGWTTQDEPGIVAGSEDERFMFGVDPNSILVGVSGPEDIESIVEVASTITTGTLELIGIDTVSYVGVGLTYAAATGSLEDGAGWLGSKLGTQVRAGLFDPFGGPPTNLVWNYEFERDDVRSKLELQPMSADSPDVDGSFLNAERLELPPEFVLLDVARGHERDATCAELPERFSQAFDKVLAAVDRVDLALRQDDDD